MLSSTILCSFALGLLHILPLTALPLVSDNPANALIGKRKPLGINCRGSFFCYSKGNAVTALLEASKDIDTDKIYKSGEDIICRAEKGNNYGFCAFLQNTPPGLSGKRIRELLQAIKDHGCGDCGSVPIRHGGEDGNNPKDGILTVNYVDSLDKGCFTEASIASGEAIVCETARKKFEWTAVGDSWTAGVGWKDDVFYDDDRHCMRTKESWAVQMSNDNSWTNDPQRFHFPACVGAVTTDVPLQLPHAGQPGVMVTTMGGNNAFFGETVGNCIYRAVPGTTYGPYYEDDVDGTSECKKSLKKGLDHIHDWRGFENEFKHYLNDIFNSDAAKFRQEFRLFVASYAHFFNVDTAACDSWSFAPWWAYGKQKMVQALRRNFNSNLDEFHAAQNRVIDNYQLPANRHLSWIPVTQGFDRHRFCEQGHSLEDQWSQDKVYFWNLQYYNPTTQENVVGEVIEQDGVSVMKWPVEMEAEAKEGLSILDFGAMDDPNEKPTPWKTRPFHQNNRGHTAMKDEIIKGLRARGVPGVR